MTTYRIRRRFDRETITTISTILSAPPAFSKIGTVNFSIIIARLIPFRFSSQFPLIANENVSNSSKKKPRLRTRFV